MAKLNKVAETAVEAPAIETPAEPVKKAPVKKAKKAQPKPEPKIKGANDVWKLVRKPDETVTGARLVICELLSKAPKKQMLRSELAKVVSKAAGSEQDGSYLLALKKKFLTSGGFVEVL
jgi:hypothetical protein